MKDLDQLVRPTRCFCEVPDDELRPWVVKRYIENRSTIELLNSTDSQHEKELISIVALLQVDDAILLAIMRDVNQSKEHILKCREAVREMLWIERGYQQGLRA